MICRVASCWRLHRHPSIELLWNFLGETFVFFHPWLIVCFTFKFCKVIIALSMPRWSITEWDKLLTSFCCRRCFSLATACHLLHESSRSSAASTGCHHFQEDASGHSTPLATSSSRVPVVFPLRPSGVSGCSCRKLSYYKIISKTLSSRFSTNDAQDWCVYCRHESG